MRQLDGCRCWLWWRRFRLAEVKVMMEVEPLSTVGNASDVLTPAIVTSVTAVTLAVVEVTPLTAVQTTWRSPMAVAVSVLMEAELFEAVNNVTGGDKDGSHNGAARADGGCDDGEVVELP